MRNLIHVGAAIAVLQMACLSPATGATAGLGTAVPDAGDGVQNLSFSTSKANNTNVQYVPSEYLAGDNTNKLGQTFATGSNAGGYSLNSISVRQVSWGTTFWDYTGGTVTLKVFTMDSTTGNGVWNTTQLAMETATVGGEDDGVTYSSGTPGANAQWLTVTLDTPVALAPNTVYGFMLAASGTDGNDGLFMEIDGTNTSTYTGGFALTTGDINGTTIWDGNNGQPSDRAFVAAMTGLSAPAAPVFVTQPQSYSGEVGDTFTLTATANAYPEPTYRWEYSADGVTAYTDVVDGGAIAGAATKTLAFYPAEFGHNGFYRVVAFNGTAVTSDPAEVALIHPAPENRVEPFPIERVRLLDSRFKSNQELHRTGYLAWLDPDRLLHPFRTNAGLPQAPGATHLGGWEGGGGFTAVRGHMGGHYLTAASKMYAATGDTAFVEKVNYLVAELKKCQDALGTQETAAGRPYGYLSAFPISYFETLETTPTVQLVPFYTIHKILAGLVDAYIHCGNGQALDMAIAMSDYHRWRVDQLTSAQVEAMFRTDNGNSEEWGGMNETLSEMSRLSAGRGDINPERHLQFARIFHRDWFITPLKNGVDQLSGLHANTHIPQVVGFAHVASLLDPTDPERKRLYDAARNFWQIVLDDHTFVIGGNSFSEHFHAPGKETGTGGSALSIGTAETCNTYNMLKLTKELFEREPSAAYADYYEHALYNHILAALSPDTGMPIYYTSLASGTFKTYSSPEGSCWCCTGSGIENTSRYNEAIYFHRDDELWVNLFIPSILDWQENGMTVTLATEFPKSEEISLGVGCSGPTEATIHLRLPSWIAGTPEVTINGTAQAVTATPGSYLSLNRTWQDGDRIGLRLPMAMRVDRSRDDSSQVSVLYGPIVLAGDLGTANMPAPDQAGGDPWQFSGVSRVEAPSLVGRDSTRPAEWVRQTSEPLVFTTTAAFGGGAERRDVTLKPFYDIHHRRYSVYWNLVEPAAIATWTGDGGTPAWSVGANWDASPTDGRGLAFANSAGGTIANDLAAGRRIAGIGFLPQAGPFVVGGNGIALGGDVSNHSSFPQRIDLPLTLDGGNVWLFDAASDLTLGGRIDGSGGIVKRGPGSLVIASDISLQRGLSVIEGELSIGDGGVTGNLQSDAVTVADGANLVFNRSDDIEMACAISGAGSLVQRGTGTLLLTTPTGHTGATVVERGLLKLGSQQVSTLLHRWSFNGDLSDSAGSATARIVDLGGNHATLSTSAVTLAGGARGVSDYVSLGAGLLPKDGSPVTVELWATGQSYRAWSRIFDVGASDLENLFVAWSRNSTSTDRVEWRDLAGTVRVDDSVAPYSNDTEYHIMLSIEPGSGAGGATRVTWHAAPAGAAALGAAKGSFDTANTLRDLNDADFWLGRSHYTADETASASYNEVRIWNLVFSESERESRHTLGPNQTGPIPNRTVTGRLPQGGGLQLGETGTFDASGEIVQIGSLAGGSGSKLVLGGGTLTLADTGTDPETAFAGSFSGPGTVVNHGVLRLVGNSPLPPGVSLVNHGLLDILTWQGTLPAGFVNNGTVLDRHSLKIDEIQRQTSGVRLRFKPYRGHQYRVQSAENLEAGSWQDTGIVVEGGDGQAVDRFIPVEAGTARRFWRLAVEP